MKATALLFAALLCAVSPISFAKPVKAFILAGQSNMEGQGLVDHDDERDANGGKGNLVWSMKHPKSAGKMRRLRNGKGERVVRDDAQISVTMVEEVRAALAELGGQEYEIEGICWQQGWNEMRTAPAIPEYAQNLVNPVKDPRKEFNVPDMPVVVGELGNGEPVTGGAMLGFRKAPEQGTKQIKIAYFIQTADFARPTELSPCPTHVHHWFASAQSCFLIGDAAGEAMRSLLR